MKSKSAFLTVLFLLTFCASSKAQVGLTLGTEYGLGGIVQVGSPAVKLEIGGGAAPLFIIWQIQDIYGINDEVYFKFYFPGRIGAKLNFALSHPRGKRLGLKLGVCYDTIMKTGVGGGIEYQFKKKPRNIVFSGGFMIFPEAYDELLNQLNEEEGTNYSKDDVTSVLMNFRPYMSVTLFL